MHLKAKGGGPNKKTRQALLLRRVHLVYEFTIYRNFIIVGIGIGLATMLSAGVDDSITLIAPSRNSIGLLMPKSLSFPVIVEHKVQPPLSNRGVRHKWK